MDNNDTKIAAIEQCKADYGEVMNFETLYGSQVQNRVLTDTYVTQDGNEERMLEQLDKAVEYAYGMRKGFAGYLSWCYAQMTLFFLLEQYDLAKRMMECAEKCVGNVESFCMTGNYNDTNGNDTGFVNFSFGEKDSDMANTLRYAKDCYMTARLVHKKAASFESGYAFVVASILYDLAMADTASALKECKNMRELVGMIKGFIDEKKNSGDATNIKDEGEFMDVGELAKKMTESKGTAND